MIVIYEPLCKEFSHEKINSGFIYSFSKAFPEEEICYCAHKTHLKAIKNILLIDNLKIENIKYKKFTISRNISFLSYIINIYNLIRLKKFLKSNNEIKIFLTSYNTLILYIIKNFKYFKGIKFYLVLHGSFEEINSGELNVKNNQILTYKIPEKDAIKRLKNISFSKLIKYIFHKISDKVNKLNFFRIIFSRKFNGKVILGWRTNDNIIFIAISKHIIINAKKILDLDKINIKYHFFPNNFYQNIIRPNNIHIKFGIFGYGDPQVLYNISKKLQSFNLQNKFEIRVIGMDNSITSYFPFITSPSNGLPLERKEMEKLVSDIDMFLILYGNQKYRLSCSATILEAISYNKPIIHFTNDCISQFNPKNARIGYEASNINEFCDHIENCIINYDNLEPIFNIFYNNLLKLRQEYSIDNNYKNLINLYI